MADKTQPDLQPTLTGPTVLIRPLRADDWEELYAVAADPLIWEQHPAYTRWKERVFRAFFDEALSWQSSFVFNDCANGRIIGSSRYCQTYADEGEIEIGWTFLARSHWGGATNAEIKRLMIDHAFTFADCVIFQVGETNWRSRGAMTKIGGKLREGYIDKVLHGVTYRHVVFEIRKLGG